MTTVRLKILAKAAKQETTANTRRFRQDGDASTSRRNIRRLHKDGKHVDEAKKASARIAQQANKSEGSLKEGKAPEGFCEAHKQADNQKSEVEVGDVSRYDGNTKPR